LAVNAITSLLDRMKHSKQAINSSSISKLYKFHFVTKFASNLVFNANNTESKAEVFGLGYEFNQRREEDAIAEIFIYEVMRSFGDRIMRP